VRLRAPSATRLYALAVDLYRGYAKYAQQTDGIRTIRVLRLTPH
jgi:hypothetical protein